MFPGASPLTLVALAAWAATAALGGNLLLRGKAYRLFLYAVSARTLSGPRPPIVRAALMGLHFLGAVSGLILWIGYCLSDRQALAEGALILLGGVALLGITVVDRWHGSGRHARQQGDGHGFPVWSATIHVMAATTTIVLVALITMLHVGA
ncbi:MAG: hypothetical protein ACM3ML_20490 [Micromonosporaceae bacterium]